VPGCAVTLFSVVLWSSTIAVYNPNWNRVIHETRPPLLPITDFIFTGEILDEMGRMV